MSEKENECSTTVRVVPKRIAHILPEFADKEDNVAPKTADVEIEDEEMEFSNLLLSKRVLDGLKDSGFRRPSPIQLQAIPVGRCGKDLIVQAKSGTGKTCVFAVLALETVVLSNPATQVVIIAPTREVAKQIHQTVLSIGCHMVAQPGDDPATSQNLVSVGCFIGGINVKDDREKSKQQCQIVVGTPGRIWQLSTEGDLTLDSVKLLVLDEADKLMEESYIENINAIYAKLPTAKQLIALSATYPRQLDEFLTRYMKSPRFIKVESGDVQLLGIKQYVWTVELERHGESNWLARKAECLHKLLSRISFKQCLVFCNYQDKVEALCKELRTVHKWPAEFIAANLSQPQRLTVMDHLKQFRIRVLVSTDLTARGIDAENVDLVVNFDTPHCAETYFHRIGRAGRFGGYGAAVTLLSRRMDEFTFFSMASENNFHVKRYNPAEAPIDMVTNTAYFDSLPELQIPDDDTLSREAEKRDIYLKNKQQQYKEQQEAAAAAKAAGEERLSYSDVMKDTSSNSTRIDPTKFVWSVGSNDQPKPTDEKRLYSRRQLFSILSVMLHGKDITNTDGAQTAKATTKDTGGSKNKKGKLVKDKSAAEISLISTDGVSKGHTIEPGTYNTEWPTVSNEKDTPKTSPVKENQKTTPGKRISVDDLFGCVSVVTEPTVENSSVPLVNGHHSPAHDFFSKLLSTSPSSHKMPNSHREELPACYSDTKATLQEAYDSDSDASYKSAASHFIYSREQMLDLRQYAMEKVDAESIRCIPDFLLMSKINKKRASNGLRKSNEYPFRPVAVTSNHETAKVVNGICDKLLPQETGVSANKQLRQETEPVIREDLIVTAPVAVKTKEPAAVKIQEPVAVKAQEPVAVKAPESVAVKTHDQPDDQQTSVSCNSDGERYIAAVNESYMSPLCHLLAGYTVDLQAAAFFPSTFTRSVTGNGVACQTEQISSSGTVSSATNGVNNDQLQAILQGSHDWSSIINNHCSLDFIPGKRMSAECKGQPNGDRSVQNGSDPTERPQLGSNGKSDLEKKLQLYRHMIVQFSEVLQDYRQLLALSANSS